MPGIIAPSGPPPMYPRSPQPSDMATAGMRNHVARDRLSGGNVMRSLLSYGKRVHLFSSFRIILFRAECNAIHSPHSGKALHAATGVARRDAEQLVGDLVSRVSPIEECVVAES